MTVWNENTPLDKMDKALAEYMKGEPPRWLLREDTIMAIVQIARRTEDLNNRLTTLETELGTAVVPEEVNND